MGIGEIILGAVLLLVSIIIILFVVLQEGRRAGVNGVISGGADTFLSKNKARTVEAKLARSTKFFAVLFFILAIVANIIALVK